MCLFLYVDLFLDYSLDLTWGQLAGVLRRFIIMVGGKCLVLLWE